MLPPLRARTEEHCAPAGAGWARRRFAAPRLVDSSRRDAQDEWASDLMAGRFIRTRRSSASRVPLREERRGLLYGGCLSRVPLLQPQTPRARAAVRRLRLLTQASIGCGRPSRPPARRVARRRRSGARLATAGSTVPEGCGQGRVKAALEWAGTGPAAEGRRPLRPCCDGAALRRPVRPPLRCDAPPPRRTWPRRSLSLSLRRRRAGPGQGGVSLSL